MALKLVEKHKSPSLAGYILIQKQEIKKGCVTYITVPENYDGTDISKVGNHPTLTHARKHVAEHWGCEHLVAPVTLKAPRHFSDRFEPKTRERKLLRSFEIGLTDEFLAGVALIDLDTRSDMVFYCDRDGEHALWLMDDDEDAWEDKVFNYPTYEQARYFFDEWKGSSHQEPNWEAQAEYDELHGTINGENSGIVAMRELWGE